MSDDLARTEYANCHSFFYPTIRTDIVQIGLLEGPREGPCADAGRMASTSLHSRGNLQTAGRGNEDGGPSRQDDTGTVTDVTFASGCPPPKGNESVMAGGLLCVAVQSRSFFDVQEG
jgi:hypothetical protein